MTSERNRRYTARPGEVPPGSTAAFLNVSGEGDVPTDASVTVEQTARQGLVSYFACRCGKRARFTPNELGRRFDPATRLWDLAPKLRCRDCNRKGDILFLTRVRSSARDEL